MTPEEVILKVVDLAKQREKEYEEEIKLRTTAMSSGSILTLTDFEKRLITAMDYGIRIESRDGHRWIECSDVDLHNFYSFDAFLRRHGILLNNKIYGTYEDALDLIDKCFVMAGHKTLLESFWQDDDDVKGCLNQKDRIDKVEKGGGGLV
jgi:hypothetical protein